MMQRPSPFPLILLYIWGVHVWLSARLPVWGSFLSLFLRWGIPPLPFTTLALSSSFSTFLSR
jgi:hypothetical protein